MKNTNIEFKVNFGVFYGSILDSYTECMEFTESEYDSIEWGSIFKEYSKDWLNLLENELTYDMDINLDFVELISPKFYNFSTDQIIATINPESFEVFKSKYLKDDDFIDYANETSKSYDGFTSFFSGIDAIKKDDSILMEYIFNYIINEEYHEECINMLNDIEIII